MRKDWRVVVETQEGSELREKGFKSAIWTHSKTKKYAYDLAEQLKKCGLNAWVEVKCM